jgi:DNA mismatch repair protein MutS2
MLRDPAVGDPVQTPMGKGVVREVRNNGRLLVQIQSRLVVMPARDVTATTAPRRHAPAASSTAGPVVSAREAPVEVDLHGLTVDEALARIDDALDAALRAGHAQLRFIHGKSGGRLRGALHQRLRGISAVRGMRPDPQNAGVTIVLL